jgi:hypothetical protein
LAAGRHVLGGGCLRCSPSGVGKGSKLQDSIRDDRFELGWEAVERRFSQLSSLASDTDNLASDDRLDILRELEEISSRIGLFADNWIHFHLRLACLVREFDRFLKGPGGEEADASEGSSPDDEMEVVHGSMINEFS